MIKVAPTTEQKRQFVMLFYTEAGMGDATSLTPEFQQFLSTQLSQLDGKELEETVVDCVSMFYEVGWTDEKIQSRLQALGLPEVSVFKALNRKWIAKILRRKNIQDGDDMVLLVDAKEAGILTAKQLAIVDALLIKYDV